jgi:hypothetical protein
MSKAQEQPADTSNIDDWLLFDDAYEAFVEAHPALGLGSGLWATNNLRRTYGERLIASGAVIKLANRRWIAHREKFGPALFGLLTKTADEILQKARARQAAAAQS